jgi:acyl-CoA thioesterase YciA
MTTTPDSFDVITRHIVMEKDLNKYGHLFGGVILAWIDEAAALYVMEQIGYSDFVTVSLDDADFKAPGHRGDAILIYGRIARRGRSSVAVETAAYALDHATNARREIINCTFTFVCLKDGEPFRYFQSDAYRDWLERNPKPAP